MVLDSAGRLQIPKEYMEQFSIKGRAKLEVTEYGILIVPAPVTEHTQAAATPVSELLPRQKKKGIWKLLARFQKDDDEAS